MPDTPEAIHRIASGVVVFRSPLATVPGMSLSIPPIPPIRSIPSIPPANGADEPPGPIRRRPGFWLARAWYWAAGPINLLVVGWVIEGRTFTGTPHAWISAITYFVAVPLLAIPLMGLTFRHYVNRQWSRTVTVTQAVIYLGLWTCLVMCGASITDYWPGKGPAASALSVWFGAHWADPNNTLALRCAAGSLALMLCLGLALGRQSDLPPVSEHHLHDSTPPPPRTELSQRQPPDEIAGYRPPLRRADLMYRHMGWLSGFVLILNCWPMMHLGMLSAMMVLLPLAVVVGGYLRTSQLTIVQYRLVTTILVSLSLYGGGWFLVLLTFMTFPLVGTIWSVTSIVAITSALALFTAYTMAGQPPPRPRPQDIVPQRGPEPARPRPQVRDRTGAPRA